MSAIGRPAYRPQNKPRDFVIAIRETPATRLVVGLACGHCGAGGMSMADFADEIGVSARDVSAFLHKRTVREDVAKKIRANVMRVVE
jgi:hypothetical protein